MIKFQPILHTGLLIHGVYDNDIVPLSLTGVAHGAYDNDIEALLGIRDLFNFLPLSNKEKAPIRKCDDPW